MSDDVMKIVAPKPGKPKAPRTAQHHHKAAGKHTKPRPERKDRR
jgi:hypothetical protein